jgi:predicted regulator of amino acid metabolism with ACT domain
MAVSAIGSLIVNYFKTQPSKIQIYKFIVNSGLHKVNNVSVIRTIHLRLDIVCSTKPSM